MGWGVSFLGRLPSPGQPRRKASQILWLVDEYRLYLYPFVLGRGKPFFPGPRPPLVTSDRIVGDVVRLTYVPT